MTIYHYTLEVSGGKTISFSSSCSTIETAYLEFCTEQACVPRRIMDFNQKSTHIDETIIDPCNRMVDDEPVEGDYFDDNAPNGE